MRKQTLRSILPLVIMLIQKECDKRVLLIAKIECKEVDSIRKIFAYQSNELKKSNTFYEIFETMGKELFDLDEKHPDFTTFLRVDLVKEVIEQLAAKQILVKNQSAIENYTAFTKRHLDFFTILVSSGENISSYCNP